VIGKSGDQMDVLLGLARQIDRLSDAIGKAVSWLVLVAVLVCSLNALLRYLANVGSNGLLETQWYLFAAIFLLAAPYTLKKNEHVRIDVISQRLSMRARAWIDIVGFLLFLFPLTLLMLIFGLPYAWESFGSQEMSSNAGGLIVWPAKLLIPLGFGLLLLQGAAEIIKRVAFLRGLIDSREYEKAAAGNPADGTGTA
jgi:TRAP-type mannitol/chloroaromatic compound transport system permease small subunit